MTKEEKKQETCRMLRSEMMILCERQDKYIIYMYTLAISCFTVAFAAAEIDSFENSAFWFFLFPIILLVPLAFRIYEARKNVVFLGTYILECLEDRTPYDWEYMRMGFLGTQTKRLGFLSFISNGAKLNALGLSLIGCFFFWIFGGKNIPSITLIVCLIIVQTVAIFVQIFLAWQSICIETIRKDMRKTWKSVKKHQRKRYIVKKQNKRGIHHVRT